uniref:Neuroendocrine protein 7B2 n=1 Tax=Dermatophagoides pteronyssinus TaxID=6956 RepID=A0A6P6XNM5_DERPT|nr:uncharacterized protein LOC113789164 isoform X1 [Dermatophagoides pteronyssinus]XP_027194461.1 uncharacterized protein LOC113789164 isoform X2 [Dermatophagoides pteronyssinus]
MNYLWNLALVNLILLFGGYDCGDQSYFFDDSDYRIQNSLLHNFIERMNEDQQLPQSQLSQLPQQQQYLLVDPLQESSMITPKDSLSYPSSLLDSNNYRIRKDLSEQREQHDQQSNELMNNHYHLQTRDDILLPREPVPRKEFLEHSSLYGHQYVQGGAGEGLQRLKPDGSIPNVQVIKSDSVLPAYCNPPNPCPIGYSADDGCLEDFINSADYSKEYQSSQECMCDSEHMFNCPGNTDENELETLARSIQNEGIELDTTINKIIDTIDTSKDDHKVVAKKFFQKRNEKSTIVKRSIINDGENSDKKSFKQNPYLTGEKLPVVAKKSPHTAKIFH